MKRGKLSGRFVHVLNDPKGYKSMNTTDQPGSPLAYSIPAAVQATSGAISRTRIFELIKLGEIDARKVGKRTVIIAESLRDFLARAPKAAVQTETLGMPALLEGAGPQPARQQSRQHATP